MNALCHKYTYSLFNQVKYIHACTCIFFVFECGIFCLQIWYMPLPHGIRPTDLVVVCLFQLCNLVKMLWTMNSTHL